MVPLELRSAKLNGSEWTIWISFDGMQGNKARCWPSVEYLAEITHLGKTTVSRAIDSLERKGLILVTRSRGSGNIYRVVNGARRPGEERKKSKPVPAKPRANNLNRKPKVDSNLESKVDSILTQSGLNSETVIRSLTKSSGSNCADEESPQTPARLPRGIFQEDFVMSSGSAPF